MKHRLYSRKVEGSFSRSSIKGRSLSLNKTWCEHVHFPTHTLNNIISSNHVRLRIFKIDVDGRVNEKSY